MEVAGYLMVEHCVGNGRIMASSGTLQCSTSLTILGLVLLVKDLSPSLGLTPKSCCQNDCDR